MRILLIQGPAQWVLLDVAAETVEFLVLPNNMFVVTALPEGETRRTP